MVGFFSGPEPFALGLRSADGTEIQRREGGTAALTVLVFLSQNAELLGKQSCSSFSFSIELFCFMRHQFANISSQLIICSISV